MYVSLWERNLYTILIKRVVDALQYIADDIRFLGCFSPDEQFEVDTRIAHFGDDALDRLLRIYPFVIQVVDGRLYKRGYLFEIRTIGHTEGNNGQYIAVVTCEILVVIFKQLRVLEGDDLAIK